MKILLVGNLRAGKLSAPGVRDQAWALIRGLATELDRFYEEAAAAVHKMTVAADGRTILVNGQMWDPAARIAEAYKIRVNSAFKRGDRHQLVQMRSSMRELNVMLDQTASIAPHDGAPIGFRDFFWNQINDSGTAVNPIRDQLRAVVKALLAFTNRRLAVLIRWTNARDAITDTVTVEMPFFLVNGCHPPEFANAVATSGT